MRNAFADEVVKLAQSARDLVLLSGDIGNRLFDAYKNAYAGRFYNCGVAEANMIGVSAGLSLCGLRPVVYTIAPFITTRCIEQIRVDICYHNLPVILVGVGAGFSYASLNATHHSCEETAMLRMLPNMHVVCPGDAVEVRHAIQAAYRLARPTYIRLGKKGEPAVHSTAAISFSIGRAIVIRPGRDACILSTGVMLPTAMEAADLLSGHGISAEVVSFHTIKPLDEPFLREAFGRFKVVTTVEEHSRSGGLGGGIAEWLSDQPPQSARLCRVGTDDRFLYEAGGQGHARACFGLTPMGIAEKTLATLGRTCP